MKTFTKIEKEIIKLISEYRRLTIRRIHVMAGSADSMAAARNAVDRLFNKRIVCVSDDEIVTFTTWFENIAQKVYAKSGKGLPEKKQVRIVKEHNSGRPTPQFDEKEKTDEDEAIPIHNNGCKISSPQPSTSIRQNRPVDIGAILSNLRKIQERCKQPALIANTEVVRERIENLYYLADVMPTPIASLLKDIADDIKRQKRA